MSIQFSFFYPTRDHSASWWNNKHLTRFQFVANDLYHLFINLRFCLCSTQSPSDAIQIYTRSKKTTWQNGFWWGEKWVMWKWPSSHPLWMLQSHDRLLLYVGVYGKSEEANWPPRAHAEGVIWTKHFMQDCWSCRWKVSSDFVERGFMCLAFHISAMAFSDVCPLVFAEPWISVRFMPWASTCSLATVTLIMVAHWPKESWDASSLTITYGKRWNWEASLPDMCETERLVEFWSICLVLDCEAASAHLPGYWRWPSLWGLF